MCVEKNFLKHKKLSTKKKNGNNLKKYFLKFNRIVIHLLCLFKKFKPKTFKNE